jgi:hypothetical protein
VPADAATIWKFMVRNWPRIAAAVGTIDTFLKEHPGVPAWFRERLGDVRVQLLAVQQRRGEAARIRGMLGILRDVAQDLDAHDATRPRVDAAEWLGHADNIERRVRLAEAQSRAERRKSLERLRAETDGLLAALIDATAHARSVPPLESGGDTEPTGR